MYFDGLFDSVKKKTDNEKTKVRRGIYILACGAYLLIKLQRNVCNKFTMSPIQLKSN